MLASICLKGFLELLHMTRKKLQITSLMLREDSWTKLKQVNQTITLWAAGVSVSLTPDLEIVYAKSGHIFSKSFTGLLWNKLHKMGKDEEGK